MKQNSSLFWPMCFMTPLVGIVWAIRLILVQARVLFIALLVVNLLVLLINTVCYMLSKKKENKTSDATSNKPTDESEST